MVQNDFDVLVIGTGPGGYVAAIRAAQLGFKVACVEKQTIGGTCLNVGCIPSKTLLQTTENYAWIKNTSKSQGISCSDLAIDFKFMMKRKEDVVHSLVDGVIGALKRNKVETFQGEAHFTDEHHIEVVNGKDRIQITSKNIIIATGSESIPLPFLPFDEKKVVSSTGVLNLESIPKKLVVIGAGVIGVELASVYARLGSEVTIVEMLDSIAAGIDSTMSKLLLQSLKKQGMLFYLGAKVTKAAVEGQEIAMSVEHEQKSLSLLADVVLVAVGRRPFTQRLGLETIGIKTTQKGHIQVDANLRTSHPHIYAIGDVIEGPMLAHRATHEGIACAEVISGRQPIINYISIPNVIYTHPEVAGVGLSENEAKAAGLDLLIGTSFFRGNPRARCTGDMEGVVKVIGDKASGRLLGMHIIGPNASELIIEGMIALDKKATLEDIAHACHPHPTLSEAIMEASQQALGWAIHG